MDRADIDTFSVAGELARWAGDWIPVAATVVAGPTLRFAIRGFPSAAGGAVQFLDAAAGAALVARGALHAGAAAIGRHDHDGLGGCDGSSTSHPSEEGSECGAAGGEPSREHVEM